jgi:ABC-type transport system involved in multi-copper enzyme maturation permease subunit
MNATLTSILTGSALMLLQFLFALPWMYVLLLTHGERMQLRTNPFQPWLGQRLWPLLAACVGLPALLFFFVSDRDTLENIGRAYAAILQLQITIDLFVVVFALLLLVWPKGGAVALAAFREGTRQPTFWLLFIIGLVAMAAWIIIPYFTLGEDYLVVKQLGYDTIMLAAIIFGTLAASLSISEEIEGRTAITVMSKPVSRRQFMLGKFLGITLAGLLMFGLLGIYFEGVLMVKHWWDKLETTPQESQAVTAQLGVVPTPAWVNELLTRWDLPAGSNDVLRGAFGWAAHAADILPGLILCFSQVMVLVALAVALATRLPVVVNLVCILAIFLLANLTPTLLAVARQTSQEQPDSTVARLLTFVARAFDTVLPDLGAFSLDPALLSDAPPPANLFLQYVGSVTLYGVIYTGIVLLFGLILFEDKDLA